MILCLDGPYGVGKTTISKVIKEKIADKEVEIIESDYYYQEWITEDPLIVLGGTMPQNNKRFISKYYELLKEKESLNSAKIFISVMSLADYNSYEGILKKLKNEGYDVIHVILTASDKVIRDRLLNDVNSANASFRLQWYELQLQIYKNIMPNEIYINTEGKSLNEIANEVITLIGDERL